MTNYHAAAGVMDELMLELIEKGLAIPKNVADDLKTGRSLTNIWLRQPDDADIEMKTVAILQNAEINLLSLAETGVSAEYANAWQEKINKAYREAVSEAVPESPSKFVTGVPKEDYWVRIKMNELAAVPELDALFDKFSLSSVTQEDDWRLIHGRKEDVSAFLAEVRLLIGKNGV